ncbi:MAG: type 1 glutamine amidotransferase [Dysgonamonadaceae bacterium]|jgi:GMP synthase-like glutamine amidotransferase|nr:type 1 glutamine amidotransferase [Dysgonamonadaceae bacterium]
MKSLRIHYFKHVPFEGLGYIGEWADANRHALLCTRFYENDKLPQLSGMDWLVVMGGPMGVYDEAEYPWLVGEKEFIRAAIEAGKTVIGICLGSQLIAEALGSKVYPNLKKEIGWFPVSLTEAAKNIPIFSKFPQSIDVLHWHGDTFDLPHGAVHLMKTDVCPNQAFLYGDRVLGLQFHLESTPETLNTMIENCRSELVPDDYVQTEKEILSKAGLCRNTNKRLADLLNSLTE